MFYLKLVNLRYENTTVLEEVETFEEAKELGELIKQKLDQDKNRTPDFAILIIENNKKNQRDYRQMREDVALKLVSERLLSFEDYLKAKEMDFSFTEDDYEHAIKTNQKK